MDDARHEDTGDKDDEGQDVGGSFEAEVGELDAVTPRVLRSFWTAYALEGQRFTQVQRLWRAGSAVGAIALLCVLLLAGSYAGTVRRLFQTPPPQPAILSAARDGLVCVSDIAWSPDSRRIAVAGYANNGCGAETYARPLILIYDARSGRLSQRIHPEAAMLDALHALLPNLPLPGDSRRGALDLLVYQNFLLWSPDGTRLGLIFLAVAYPQTGWTSITGLLTVGADGTRPAAYLHLLDPATPVGARPWDLMGAITTSAADDVELHQAIPPALAYTWGGAGDLAPQEPLGGDFAPLAPNAGPVGSPARDATFTVWQPGAVISLALRNGSGYTARYQWTTRFAAWSPDGRYVVSLIHVLAFLSVGGEAVPNVAALPTDQGAQIVLPVRDEALMSLLRATPPNTAAGEWEVAWRPDGRELAAFRLANEPEHTASIYDCATGRILKTLPLATASDAAFLAGNDAMVRWSPDGTHLLLFSPLLGAIALWGPKDLPK